MIPPTFMPVLPLVMSISEIHSTPATQATDSQKLWHPCCKLNEGSWIRVGAAVWSWGDESVVSISVSVSCGLIFNLKNSEFQYFSTPDVLFSEALLLVNAL